ncbi:MAG TPA: S41 family peptidase [Solirubrobacterales bacterium]
MGVKAEVTSGLDVLASEEQSLTDEERRLLVRQARVLIEQMYVHLPLKRAMHAVDPLQRLRLLDRRLTGLSERAFHDEMLRIFNGLRDLHTNYVLPAPYANRKATLPFRIEAYWEDETPRYLVTEVAPGVNLPPFARGVEVTHWNGMPIDRAVALNGDRNAGSNMEARQARGLASLTHRSMRLLAEPDEAWVTVTFQVDGASHEQRFDWTVGELAPVGVVEEASAEEDQAESALGLDLLAEDIRRSQKQVLAPEAMELEGKAAAGEIAGPDLNSVSKIPDALQFRKVPGPNGDLGYLRIRAFNFEETVPFFVEEVVRILGLLPQNGLIIDVRGNGGGKIMAGEMLLQLFTPRRIEPEQMCFINSDLTLAVTEQEGFQQWNQSIKESVETGSPYSDALPLVEQYPELLNSIGQRYHGPVTLIIDALCYSTTDIFAAGFQDHKIGPVIGTSRCTGAGGANVWEYALLQRLLPNQFGPLPKGASMRVAVRRTSRVGSRSGDPVEDLGVTPDHLCRMTKRDLLDENPDLIAFAGQTLAQLPVRLLDAAVAAKGDGLELTLTTKGLDRVDALLAGRPRDSWDVADGQTVQTVSRNGAAAPAIIELRGFAKGELAISRRLGG